MHLLMIGNALSLQDLKRVGNVRRMRNPCVNSHNVPKLLYLPTINLATNPKIEPQITKFLNLDLSYQFWW